VASFDGVRGHIPAPDVVAGLLDETFLALHARRSMYVLGADPRRGLLELAEGVVARERRRRQPGRLRRRLESPGGGAGVPALRGAS